MKNEIDNRDASYWLFVPGVNASMFDVFFKRGIMAVGMEGLNVDLNEFKTLDELIFAMKDTYKDGYTHQNDALCFWQLAKVMKIGDVVFAKQGRNRILGVGVVVSDYIYDGSIMTYRHTRKVDWKARGEYDMSIPLPSKTLTNITSHKKQIGSILDLFE